MISVFWQIISTFVLKWLVKVLGLSQHDAITAVPSVDSRELHDGICAVSHVESWESDKAYVLRLNQLKIILKWYFLVINIVLLIWPVLTLWFEDQIMFWSIEEKKKKIYFHNAGNLKKEYLAEPNIQHLVIGSQNSTKIQRILLTLKYVFLTIMLFP